MEIETKKQLEEILNLLCAEDYESQVLGYTLFRNSKFRKYIRNKCYSFVGKSQFYEFYLNSLLTVCRNEGKKEFIDASNQGKIHNIQLTLSWYIRNEIIIYDYSKYKRRYKK